MHVDLSASKKPSSYSLTNVMVNDFGDNYHRLDNEPSNDLERKVRKIRRRYKSFSEYKAALVLYFEYMDLLAEKYGGKRQFIIRLESNTVFEYVPPYPKIKKNKLNDFVLSNGINISDPHKLRLDEDLLEEMEEEFKEYGLEDNVEQTAYVGLDKDKEIRELIKSGLKSGKLSISKLKDMDTVDMLESYFGYSQNSSEKKSGKSKYNKKITLSDIVYDEKSPYYEDDDDEISTFYHGRMVTKKELQQIKFYEDLSQHGWNSLRIMKGEKGSSSSIRDVLEDKKDKEKRNKKRNKASKAADDFLMRAMGDNGEAFGSFEDFEQDMLSMSVNKLFR